MPDLRKLIIKKTGTTVDIVSKVDTTLSQENIPGDAKVIGEKLADLDDKISNIQISGTKEVFNANTHFEFPSIGSVDYIYKAYKEKKTYQWNAELLIYEPLNTNILEEITMINGGNSNGI